MMESAFKRKCKITGLILLLLISLRSFSTTYTWNNTNGGAWTGTANWTPASPSGGPPAGSDIVIPALLNNTKFISAVPQITLNSITCTGVGTSWMQSATSGNTIIVTGNWIVPTSHTITIGATSARFCVRMLSASTMSVDGGIAFDAGTTNRAFEIYGTLVVNANGTIFDPNPTGGSDFYFFSGATLKTQKIQGFTLTSATTTANINYSVAVSTGGSYSYGSGVNYEFNGTADQVTGAGLGQNTPSNVIINNAVTKIVTLSAAAGISGSLVINSLSTFNAAALSFSLGAASGTGNFVNNGTFSAATSTLVFNGNAAQTISGATTTTFNCLTLNNASGLTLATPAAISGNLALTAGQLNTSGTNLLTLLSGAVAPAITAAATSYINGPLICQKSTSGSSTLNFPIGKSSDCRPMQLVVNHANTNLYNYTGELFNASAVALAYTKPGTVDTVSSVHYWDLTRTNSAAVNQPTLDLSGTQTLKLNFGANDVVKDLSTLRIVKNTYSATTTWIDLFGGSTGGTTANGNITSVGFNSFSRFTLGGSSGGVNPLPITLLDFTALRDNDQVALKWTTMSEKNSDYFTVEKSLDGINFEFVAQIKGASNSDIAQNYLAIDNNPAAGVNYYRLKMTDLDGTSKYYKIVFIDFAQEMQKDVIFYPNPARSGRIFVMKNNEEVTGIEIFNSLGQRIYASGEFSTFIDISSFSADVYQLRIYTQAKTITQKLIVEN